MRPDRRCELVEREPACGEAFEPTIVDNVGVPEAHAIVISGARWHVDRALGDYVSGVAPVYRGSARVTIEGAWRESFELAEELGVLTSGGMADSGTLFQSRDETGAARVELRQAPGEDEIELSLGTSTTGSCAANGLDLSRSEDRIAATLTCESADVGATAEVVLDYARVASEQLSVDEGLQAARVAGAWPRWQDRLVSCGSGRVYDTEATFTDVRGESDGTTTWHVDTRTTWYVAEECPQTIGATRIEILRVESCYCPPDGHCHGRSDESCVCLGEVPEDDPICAWR